MLALLILLGAFALRLWHLNTESIWHDEGWSIRAFRGPFTTPDDNTPYLYYLSGHLLWRLGGGETAFALRYVSVLIGTVTAALALRLGLRWLRLEGAAAFGVMVAVSPLLWEYAQEVRAYVAVPLVALALLAGADALLRYDRRAVPRRVWAFVFVVELLGLYTHNLTVPLIVWLNVALGVVWLLRRDVRRMVTWAGVQVALILAYIPWLLTQSPSGTPLNTPPEPGFALARDIWYSAFLPVLGQVQAAENPPLLNLLGVVFVLLAVVRIVRAPTTRTWLLVSHVVLVPAFSTALMIAAHIDFHPRYYIAFVPGMLFLLAAGAANKGSVTLNPAPWPPPRPRAAYTLASRLTLVLVTVLVLIASAMSLHDIRTTRTYQHDDFAGLAAYYATLPADAVILVPFNAERALQDYYAQAADIQAQFVNVPLYADEATALTALRAVVAEGQPRHVELLTWFQLPADPRGMYPCMLSAASVPDAEYQERFYFGLSTQTYVIDPARLETGFVSLNTPADYRGAVLEDAAVMAGAHTSCLRTDWRLLDATDENLRAAAVLLDPLGGVLARSEYDLTRADNAGTANWSAGERGQVYHLLALLTYAPPLAYDAGVTAYSPSQPNGLDLLDAGGSPRGKTLVLHAAVTGEGRLQPPLEDTRVISTVPDTVATGRPFEVTLEIQAAPERDLPLTVALVGEGWELRQESPVDARGGLSWHRFRIPEGGTAQLQVEGEVIAEYSVLDVPRLLDPPAAETPVNIVFPGVGALVGATLTSDEVTLVWRAAGNTPQDYTVFVQMLAPDGRIIAQSDQRPTRPTSGWVDGEYIVDRHTLRYNVPDYTGEVQIIAGFYDGEFARLLTSDGTDFATLGVITVP
ncbi:MAG: hypothetical protein OHK0046_44800 [Anaerolineae bacterium]